MSAIVAALFLLCHIISQPDYVLAREKLVMIGYMKHGEATRACEDIGYHLLTVETPEQLQYIGQFIIDKGYSTSYFFWVSGTCLPYGCQYHGGVWRWEEWENRAGQIYRYRKLAKIPYGMWCSSAPNFAYSDEFYLALNCNSQGVCCFDDREGYSSAYAICSRHRRWYKKH